MSHGPGMLFLLCAFLVSSLSLLAGQVPGISEEAGKSKASAKPSKRPFDACALLPRTEVETVLGEPVKETKSTTQLGGGMNISQCLFLTPTFAKSLSLSVTLPDSAHSAKTIHAFWNHQFHASESHSIKESEGKQEAEESPSRKQRTAEENEKPRFISGLGQEAYWVGSPIAGALYVLQDGTFVRVSVGGVRQESARIEKSKAIAIATVAKLPHRPSSHL